VEGVVNRTIFLLLLVFVYSNAAADWSRVRVSDDGNATAYMDRSTILKEGGKARMWALLDFRLAKTSGGETYLSTRQHDEFDCQKRKIRLLRFLLYSGNMANGEVVYESHDIGRWTTFSAGELSEELWKAACAKK
jgi:hypothetical protein